MKKKSARRKQAKRSTHSSGHQIRRPSKKELERLKIADPQIYEFLTTDTGDAIAAAGGGIMIHPKRALPTSILLELDLVKKLKEKSAKRGMGYQTLLKQITREHIDEY